MLVVSGFFRVTTNSKVFLRPSSAASAVEFVDWLLDGDGVTSRGSGSEWPAFRQIMLDRQRAANEVPGAWLAALSLVLSEPFVTFGKRFRKSLPRALPVLLKPT